MSQVVNRIKCGNGNCYIIEGESGSVLVDTAKSEYRDQIISRCIEKNVKLIILTHGHIDHCENAYFISRELGVPIAMCKKDEELIQNNLKQKLNAKSFLGKVVLKASIGLFKKGFIERFTPSIYLKEGDTLEEYGVRAKIIELPGHTKGSIGVDIEGGAIIVGDALMNMFYPTVSMLYNDYKEMRNSVKKIEELGERTVYFGHGKPIRNRKWLK